MTDIKLSLCMILKNEEYFLENCLKSVEGIVDEIIAVDSGSTDKTMEIAKSFGAEVVEIKWQNDFSRARNVSLDYAKGDWILVLDADEELPTSTRKSIRNVVDQTEASGIILIQRNLAPEDEMEKYSDLASVRLFRNLPEFRYENCIHEQIRPSILSAGCTIEQTDLIFLHYGYMHKTSQGGVNRAERNLELIKDTIRNNSKDPYLYYQLGVTFKSLGKSGEAYNSFKESLSRGAHEKLGGEILSTIYTKLAQIDLENNNFDKAVKNAKVSLSYDNDNNPISLLIAGTALMFQNKFSEAYSFLVNAYAHSTIRNDTKAELNKLISFCETRLQ